MEYFAEVLALSGRVTAEVMFQRLPHRVLFRIFRLNRKPGSSGTDRDD
jgi:hypothetical protein